MNKTNKLRNLHILLIAIGSLFLILSSFHENMWFDESYTVALSKQSFKDIWTIGSKDVHPILYYYIVKIIFLLTNNNIMVARVFSAVPLIILSILGITHISKDFGEKVGILFTTLVFISPAILMYSSELRMYTWAILFVTLMCIYAYRILNKNYSKKNWTLFAIFSLASAYTHYYALVTSGITNLILLIYFIAKIRKSNSDEKKIYKKQIITFLIQAIIEVVLYLPWIGSLLGQTKKVSTGYWIYAPTPLDIMIFLCTGELEKANYVLNIIYSSVITALVIYMFIHNWKNKEIKPAKIIFGLFFTLLIVMIIISIIIGQVLVYPRYFFVLMGVLIFAFALLLSKEKNWLVYITLIVLTCYSLFLNIALINENYDKQNSEPYKYMQENYREGDIILTSDKESGFEIIASLQNENNYKNMYCYDVDNWHVEKAYKAYGKTVWNLDDFKDFKGRIWVISDGTDGFASRVKDELGGTPTLDSKYFATKYKNCNFQIDLIQK